MIGIKGFLLSGEFYPAGRNPLFYMRGNIAIEKRAGG